MDPIDPMETPAQNGDDSSQQHLFEEARRRVDSQTPTHDSPSRQLLMEFSRMLIDNDAKFHKELDRASAEQEKKHLEALAAAAAEHERVRQSAERVAEKFRLQVEQERRRREEHEHRELDRIRQENTRIEAERRQRQLDEVKRKEEEQRKAAEAAKALEAAEERLRRQKAQEEADAAKRKAEQEERQRKEREESAAADAAAKARAQQQQAAQTQQAPAVAAAVTSGAAPTTAARPAPPLAASNSPLVSSFAEHEAVHREYLNIHQQLKTFRTNFQNETKNNAALKKIAGDLRREIRMRMGQLTLNPRENRDVLQHLRACFTAAVNTPCFTVDVKQFLASSTQAELPPGPCNISALLIFLFNHFAKAIINQLVSEAGVNIKAADPIGIIAVSILGFPQYCINQKVPLTDILLAKYHKCCGVLFGMYGPENSERGRQRLGWRRIGTKWCSGQDHLERMTGLGAGWASLALRKIKVGSALVHPLPNAHYWRAFSRIVNTPPHEATATHYMVLKAMVEGDSLDRFVQCYGQAALAALRKGLIEFPQGHDSVAAKSMLGLVEGFQKEKRLTL
ncbi:gle1-like protein [Diplodia corticola]|uniref:mRNA export factor GLE1 n=1 Tax=Diplodia corticola TaxID=236234 RepID=A0A1J9SDS9_9PEZI|nr:gle1-like protein [Diplodia corticola]OJD38591.1 gle1-like protein [Diplodia corticola]